MRKANKKCAMSLFAFLALSVGVAKASTVNCYLPKYTPQYEKSGPLSISWTLHTELIRNVVTPTEIKVDVKSRKDTFREFLKFPEKLTASGDLDVKDIGKIRWIEYQLPLTDESRISVMLFKSSDIRYFGVPEGSYVIEAITQIGTKNTILRSITTSYLQPESEHSEIIKEYYYGSTYYSPEKLDYMPLKCFYTIEDRVEEGE
ncbi:MAG TPA: hypothetical protein VKR58_06465 [Aquella sp.]|nr:hypothetical protein [Aquella sp.]